MQVNKIENLIQVKRRLQSNEILDPDFQRDDVWGTKKYCDLYNSIIEGIGVGQIALWETPEYSAIVRSTFKESTAEGNISTKYLVLDGKQRLMGLETLLLSKDSGKASQVYLDLKTGRFTPRSNGRTVKVANIMSKDLVLDEDESQILEGVKRKIFDFEVSIVIYQKITIERAIEIFNRINTSGTRLTKVNIFAARTRSEEFNFYERSEKLRSIIKPYGYENLKDKTILHMLSVIEFGVIKGSKIELFYQRNKDLQNAFDTLETAIMRSIRYLDKILGIKAYEEVHYEFHLIALVYLFSKSSKTDVYQNKILTAWIIKSAFANRYKGANYDLMDNDLVAIDMLRDSSDKSIINFAWTPNNQNLIFTNYQKKAAITKAMLTLLKLQEPRSITDGSKIFDTKKYSVLDNIEHHHFFPKDYLKRREMTKHINSLMNITMLTKDDNIALSDSAPSNVLPLFHMNLKSEYNEVMKSLALDIDERIYYENDYMFFLEERAKKIKELIKEVITVA